MLIRLQLRVVTHEHPHCCCTTKARADAEVGIQSSSAKEFIRMFSMIQCSSMRRVTVKVLNIYRHITHSELNSHSDFAGCFCTGRELHVHVVQRCLVLMDPDDAPGIIISSTDSMYSLFFSILVPVAAKFSVKLVQFCRYGSQVLHEG